MTAPTDEQVAAGLSEAQKRAVIADDLDSLSSGQFKKLCLTGAAWYLGKHVDLESGDMVLASRRLRSKGLRIRAILERQNS